MCVCVMSVCICHEGVCVKLWCKGLITEIAQPFCSSFTHIGRGKIYCSLCFGLDVSAGLGGVGNKGGFEK